MAAMRVPLPQGREQYVDRNRPASLRPVSFERPRDWKTGRAEVCCPPADRLMADLSSPGWFDPKGAAEEQPLRSHECREPETRSPPRQAPDGVTSLFRGERHPEIQRERAKKRLQQQEKINVRLPFKQETTTRKSRTEEEKTRTT